MNTLDARSVSTSHHDTRNDTRNDTRHTQDAAAPLQAAAACRAPLAARLAAWALSAVLSLGLVQTITYGMGQQSGGVSLAQHLQSPNVALQVASASSAAAVR